MKLFIFDLDGTLVNSLADLAASANYALKQKGYPEHNIEKYRYFVGDGIPKLIERILPESERTSDNITEVKEIFDTYYHKHYADETAPYDGISELIDELKCKGYCLAVASNKADDFTKAIVNTFFKGKFDIIQGKADDTAKKPAPDIILKIMHRLNAATSDTVMVGDTNVDIYTAKNAAIKSIGCLWGFRTKSELENAGADFIANEPIDIINFIQKGEN